MVAPAPHLILSAVAARSGNGGDSPAPGDGEGPPTADANDANADGQGDAAGGEEGDVTGPALAPDRRFAPARSGMSAFLGGGGAKLCAVRPRAWSAREWAARDEQRPP